MAAALQKHAGQKKAGPTPAGGVGAAGGGGAATKLKVWDYLTDVCGMVGHNIRMVGTTIVVQRPRTLYDRRFPGRPDDPFTGRIMPSGRVLPHRLYVYGHNLTELKFKRKFTTAVPRNVEIQSYDTTKKRMIIARYPTSKGDRLSKPTPGDQNEQTWWVITRPEIRDEKTARILAQSVYEAQGRSELEVRAITKNLASFGGGNLDPDALDLLPGDALDIEMSATAPSSQNATALGDIQAAMQSRPRDYLMGLGFSAAFAEAYAKAVVNIGLSSTFRCKTVGIDWDMESAGVTIDIEAMNYIEVRNDKELADDEQISPSDVTSAATAGTKPVKVTIEDT